MFVYAAIAATPALGTVAVEPERAADGSVHIRLDPGDVARLKALRGPGESSQGNRSSSDCARTPSLSAKSGEIPPDGSLEPIPVTSSEETRDSPS